jgi:predicted O-methyltransferase YrrM
MKKARISRAGAIAAAAVIAVSGTVAAEPAAFRAGARLSPATLESVLGRYIEALGGKDALSRIRSRTLRGELVHEYPDQAPPKYALPAEVAGAVPVRWRLVLKTAGGVQQMGFDGHHGWLQNADRVLIDERQARSRLAYLFDPQGPLHLRDYFIPEALEGPVDRDGRTEYAVKARGAGGNEETLVFDAATGLLLRIGGSLAIKDYRREGGVLHPVHIEIALTGGTATYRFEKIEVNAPIEDARFAIPKLGEVFPDAFSGLTDPRVVPLLKDFPSVHEDMNVPCRDGRFLHDLIVRKGYARGLEIGSFTGYSALWLGLAFKATGGRLVSLEVDPAAGAKARENVRQAGLESVVDVRIADAFKEIPKIEGAFDFVFIDAWKPDYIKFLKLVRARVPAGGVIVGHNVTNHAQDMRDYLEAIENDPGLETAYEELSAEGMSVSVVRDTGTAPPSPAAAGRTSASAPAAPVFSVEDLRQDLLQLRRILDEEHAHPYDYTAKAEFDALFEESERLLDRPMRYEEFFRIAAPLAAKIGCLHTALWMPGRFFELGADNMFPVRVRLIEGRLVVAGGYGRPPEIPVGSVILDINGLAADKVFDALRTITSADALNPHFIDTQVEKRFAMFYASVFGFPEKYAVTYTLPGGKARAATELRPAGLASVRKVVFANFDHPPLTIEFLEALRTAVITVKTFIYYDRVDYFRDFMANSFREIKAKRIENLILDLRGNDGGDPFCAVILYSYLEREPAPYFAEPYGRYAPLAEPVPLAEDHFTGNLYTLLDGRCGSTNGHFCALLKSHGLGKFVGTPSGSTYVCNAGKSSEVRLDKTSLILTLGRSSFAAAVQGMDKSTPIYPDHPVRETYQGFLDGRDAYMETALELIKNGQAGKDAGDVLIAVETITFPSGPFKIVGELRLPEGEGRHPDLGPAGQRRAGHGQGGAIGK